MISLGTVSIAFLPFWCLDAKGGEMVLVGYPWDLHGSGHKHLLLSFLKSLCSFYFVC